MRMARSHGQHDVIVIGGGVIGLSIARELAQASLRVALLDRQELAREASWAGAGIFPPSHPGHPDAPLVRLTSASHALWPSLSGELRETTGIDNGFRVCGGITLDPRMTDVPEQSYRGHLTVGLSDQIQAWRQAGVQLQLLSAPELQACQPELAATTCSAFLLPHLAQVRNPWHLQALIADCRRLGVDLRPATPVRDLRLGASGPPQVITDQGTLPAERVVIAAGAWSRTLLESFTGIPEIQPVRGQIVLLRQAKPTFTRVIECGNRYLVPRADGHVLVGATEERVGFEKRTSVSAIAGLMQFATQLVPGLANADVERAWAGLRPFSPSGLPVIGPLPDAVGVVLAAGHFRAGLHLSPITARLVRQLILQQPTDLAMDPFLPPRG